MGNCLKPVRTPERGQLNLEVQQRENRIQEESDGSIVEANVQVDDHAIGQEVTPRFVIVKGKAAAPTESARSDLFARSFDSSGTESLHVPNESVQIGKTKGQKQNVRRKEETHDLRVGNQRLIEENIMHRNENDRIKDTIKTREQELTWYQHEMNRIQQQLIISQKENEDLKNRLSANASAQLRDNNPDIVDLSDVNRPNKIGERFSELYDNEWTNAFSELTETLEKTEKQAICILLKLLKTIYETCTGISTRQLDDLKTQIMRFTGRDQFADNMSASTKIFKDDRKHNYAALLPNVEKEVLKACDAQMTTVHSVKNYVSVSTEICWLMSIQDPPVFMHANCNKGDTFDDSLFKSYTQRSKRVAFLVWPALLLHANGPLLAKGVAQGKVVKKNDTPTSTGNRVHPQNDTWATTVPSVASLNVHDPTSHKGNNLSQILQNRDKPAGVQSLNVPRQSSQNMNGLRTSPDTQGNKSGSMSLPLEYSRLNTSSFFNDPSVKKRNANNTQIPNQIKPGDLQKSQILQDQLQLGNTTGIDS